MLTQLKSWQNLQSHFSQIKNAHLSDLFASDVSRTAKYTLKTGELYLDYSKNRITDETLALFWNLLDEVKLKDKINAMFTGEKINTTEARPVLHIALRNRSNTPIMVDGKNIMDDVNVTLEKMRNFCNKVRNGEWKGYSGKRIKNIINIGIGGSYLGPLMAYEALKSYSDRSLTFRFISNIDPADFYENTRDLNPEETLFIIASKTFTTLETMTNAESARKWVVSKLNNESSVAKHFVALSTNLEKVEEFGIDPTNMFIFWDWVGGRYSLTSAIGLSLMIAIGPEQFDEMLDGFHLMDNHFKNSPFDQNMPVILAILGVWYNNFFGSETHMIIPYSQYLNKLPAYLTQGDMESNGKSFTVDGERVDYQTGPIIWGDTGTNVQHASTQLIFQGTKLVPCDFIGFINPISELYDHHKILLTNMAAQTEALAFGRKDAKEVYRIIEGNRPTNSIIASKLTPNVLGQLISLYEHNIFTQGAIWGINSFDQFGVELGKELAKSIMPEMEDPLIELKHDASTNKLIEMFRS